jgi:hypothetical protein
VAAARADRNGEEPMSLTGVSRSGRPVTLTGWPEGTHPRESSVFAHNEVLIDASPQRVWDWLVDAGYWSRWYFNAAGVTIDSGGKTLRRHSLFSWITFGVRITSRVHVYDPPCSIGWLWWRTGARGYHGWLLEPVGSGCRVVTEESQQGFIPATLGFLLQPALSWAHGHWLSKLAREARLGTPPDA